MSKGTWPACACLALLLHAWSGLVQAQAQTYEDEYLRRLKVFQTIDPHGETPFGEQLNPYTGDLSFKQADVVLPGTGPTISLVRQTASFQRSEPRLEPRALGDWELSIPRIETIVGAPRGPFPPPPGTLWQAGPSGTERCTHFSMPTYLLTPDAWHGFTLFTEDGNQQALLKRDPGNTRQPSMTGANGQPVQFPAVTTQNWQIGCLPATSNGEVGEAFLVVSPDGTKYWFDHLVGERMPDYIEHDIAGNIYYGRMLATMYVTRIEDRFGNWVKYQYNGDEKLDAITASDGRYVTIAWRSDRRVIDHITVEPGTGQRIWQYTYNGEKLASAILPDASRWTFDLNGIGGDYPSNDETSWCTTRQGDNGGASSPKVSTLVHPSGLTGTFMLDGMWHARSYVSSSCAQQVPGGPYRETTPPLFATSSLIEKQFSGAGMATQTWTYGYPDAIGSAARDQCAADDSCPDTKAITVTTPGGDRVVHTYSNRWGAHEGKLLNTRYYEGASTLLRTETHAYRSSSGGPWPAILGDPLVTGSSNRALQQTWTPQWQRTTTQQGATFQYTVNSFDSFARPTSVTRDSSLNAGRVETTSYHDKLDDWVLGQVHQVQSSGFVVSQTDYDAATALPLRTYSFGLLQQTLTYNTNGTLATVKDGNNNITTLSNWKRGIPQAIQFPATPDQPSGTSISAVVNDHGWITSTTDENGYTTSYQYDAMGRQSRISQPAGDEVNWSDTISSFVPTQQAEYGIPAGHWRQVVVNGNYRKATYYDALWRPVLVREFDNDDIADTDRYVATTYDAAGHPDFAAYPVDTAPSLANGVWSRAGTRLAGVRTRYDALDRVTATEQDNELSANPLVTTTEYPAGFKTRVTNPRGFQTTTSYMAYDQPTTDWPVATIHPGGAFTDITRDAYGKLTAITRRDDPGNLVLTRSYAYDTAQQLCRTTEPETGATLMGYDAAGNLAWSASGLPAGTACNTAATPPASAVARAAVRSYDARNRLLTLRFPNGLGDQDWDYTPDGLPEQIVTWNAPDHAEAVVNTYLYNKRRLLTEESSESANGTLASLDYAYTPGGHLAAQQYPDGRVVQYEPNALGQATRAADPDHANPFAWGATYHPNGALKSFVYGNGIVHTTTLNTRGLPERRKDAYGSVAYHDDSYDYDGNGNLLAISDGLPGHRGDRDMTYSGRDRLTDVVSPMYGSSGAHYDYNVLDNIERVTAPGRDYYYCYDDNNRLTNLKTGSCSGTTVHGLGYDLQGNLSNYDGREYRFDFGNRLRRVVYAGVDLERYQYDGHGRRVSATNADGRITSLYAQAGQLVYQHDLRQQETRSYVQLGGRLVYVMLHDLATDTYAHRYQHVDALGSPVAVTDPPRAVRETSEYEPYGKVLNRPLRDGAGYTGHAEDAVTGLNYMQQRYYWPEGGIFLSVDAVTAYSNPVGAFNRFWYASNNPYRFTDPDGREVLAKNEADRAQLAANINARTPGTFEFTEAGSLRLVNAGDGSKKGSAYYQNRLIKAIASEKTINLAVNENISRNGRTENVDRKYGGGVTGGEKGGNTIVVVSGNSNSTLQDVNSGSLRMDAPDILMHELVGHAIPRTVETDTGNAVANENKARSEIKGSGMREEDRKHGE